MKILVNEKLMFSNIDLKPLIPAHKRDFLTISDEVQTAILPSDPEILKYKLDEFKLPSILTKGLREMDCEELIELDTTRTEKLVSVFSEENLINKDWFKKGDKIRIFLYIINVDRVSL